MLKEDEFQKKGGEIDRILLAEMERLQAHMDEKMQKQDDEFMSILEKKK